MTGALPVKDNKNTHVIPLLASYSVSVPGLPFMNRTAVQYHQVRTKGWFEDPSGIPGGHGNFSFSFGAHLPFWPANPSQRLSW